MPLGPTRLSSRALKAGAALLRVPGTRALVRSSFLQYVHLETLDAADLQGVAPWRAGTVPEQPDRPT